MSRRRSMASPSRAVAPLKLSFWLRLVYPDLCVICGAHLGEGESLVVCHICQAQIKFISRCCPRCGCSYEMLPQNKEFTYLCGECRRGGRLYFSKARSLAFFEGVLKELIHYFKYKLHPSLGPVLGKILIQHFPPDLDLTSTNLILPIPLHPSRLRERGFNQSAALAKAVAKHFGKPLLLGNLTRRHPSPPQVGLSIEKRKANVRRAFTVEQPRELAGESVLLVDDVYTTGATTRECAKSISAAGAKEIQVLTLARTR